MERVGAWIGAWIDTPHHGQSTSRRLLIAAGARVAMAAGAVAFFDGGPPCAARAARAPTGLRSSGRRRQRQRYVRRRAGVGGGFRRSRSASRSAPDGVIYVTDGGSHRVRRLTVDGRVETVRRRRARFRRWPGDSGAVRHTVGDCHRRGGCAVCRGHRQSRRAANHARRRGLDARRRRHRGRRRRTAPHASTGQSGSPSTAPAG